MPQPTIEQIRERIADIHGRNIAAGWWTDPTTGESLKGKRPALELLALVHSEVSEGLEGLRKNLPDDKLPERPMIEVELADAEIRTYDLMGGFNLEPVVNPLHFPEVFTQLRLTTKPSEALGLLHIIISGTSVAMIEGHFQSGMSATSIILFIHAIADKFGYDVDGARDAKLLFNETREDHKLENRVKVGGKLI